MYLIANVVLSIALTVFTLVALNTFFNLIDPERNFYLLSPFFDRVLFYTTSQLSQLSFLYVFLYGFRHSLDKSNKLMTELNRNSYSVYIIHTIVLGVIALTLKDLAIPSLVKFFLLSLLTFGISNLLIYSWRIIKHGKVNVPTIVTAAFSLLIVLAAFQSKPEKSQVAAQQVQQSENIESQTHSSIHAAVIAGDLKAVQKFIDSGRNLNETEPAGGSSPLITAAMFGKTAIAKALIDAGAELNFTNNDGSTALHSAAFFCSTEIVRELLKHGADASIVNKSGSTALQSVQAPFSMVKGVYEYFAKVYEPLGLQLDLAKIEQTRPKIAELISSYN